MTIDQTPAPSNVTSDEEGAAPAALDDGVVAADGEDETCGWVSVFRDHKQA